MALSEARKNANKKWDEKNKARKQYLNKRSLTKSFIRNLATDEDIEEIAKLVEERIKK